MVDLSIIIPHYNCPDLLERLLLSIGHHDNTEIIVVDDKSNKATDRFDIIKKQYASTCEFFDNNTGIKGAGTCRNIGMDHAIGTWLLFADADDVMTERWYAIAEQFFNSSADVVYFAPTSVKGDAVGTRHLGYEKLIKDYIARVKGSEQRLREQFVSPWSKLVNREFVKNRRIYYSQVLHANDVLFGTKVGVSARTIDASSASIYCISHQEGSLTDQKNFDALYIRQQEQCKRYHFLKDNLNSRDFRRSYVNSFPLATIAGMIKNSYGWDEVYKMVCLYKTNNVPIIAPRYFLASKMKKYIFHC